MQTAFRLAPSGLAGCIPRAVLATERRKEDITMIPKQVHITLALLLLSIPVATAAGARGKMANPDFTGGDTIPEGASHDWTLGATGARGWMFSEKLVTDDARQIAITKVEKGSPADGILAVGDIILGVAGKPFAHDPRTELGKALTVAESDAGAGNLSLIRWRDGKTGDVVVKLPVLGTYSATVPYDCPKSQRILEQGCKALAQQVADPAYKPNAIVRSLNALALLASGNPDYVPLVRKEAQWAAEYSADSFHTWWYGYVIMLLSEYVMATGDNSVMPGLRRLALSAANGQSIVGSWGHKFAGPDGRLVGYGMMNAPGLPLTISLILARDAGVDDPAVPEAIEKSARLLRFYIGKGAVPYGDHHPWIETHEDNGKCGMAAVLFNLLEERNGAEFFSRMSVTSHGAERDTGHTGNFCNILWSLPGVAQAGPNATGAWMQEFGAWYFDLARCWDGTFVHQGPPGMKNDSYPGWDCTGGYLLAYAMPLKRLRLTGKRPGVAPLLDAATAQALILDGRGWSNKDRDSTYNAMSDDELLEHLGSWSPVVRERAAMTLARRKSDVVPALLIMLESPRTERRIGACQALAKLRGAAAPAVTALRKALKHDNLWLRIKAADALAAIGSPAMPAVPELLEMLAKEPAEQDPRGMEQRYLCFALFNQRGGMLSQSLDGVDRDPLRKAVAAGLRNQDGRARGVIGGVYGRLTYEEIKPLLPAIYQAVIKPAPSGIMFADGIRIEGLRLLAKHRIREGMAACVDYVRTQNRWASEKRTPDVMKIVLSYGAHAKTVIPEMERVAESFDNGEESFPLKLSQGKAGVVRETIRAIENATECPELIGLGTNSQERR